MIRFRECCPSWTVLVESWTVLVDQLPIRIELLPARVELPTIGVVIRHGRSANAAESRR